MSATIDSLFGRGALAQAILDGDVRLREHPEDPDLRIANYTEQVQYGRKWTEVTRACRGLIFRAFSGEIVSRPWPKFFNLAEHPEDKFHPNTLVSVTDKMDGSLGILYPSPEGGHSIATRGSFTSEQAIAGTEMLQALLEQWEPAPRLTYLFEIIYPENRIVVDYGTVRDLVLLGIVDTASGFPLSPSVDPDWPGPRVDTLPANTLGEALALPERENAEGIVVRMLRTGTMVKIKQDDYVRLHKLVTGLNERAVWEHLSANQGNYEGLLAQVPDEFHEWVKGVAEGLLDQHGVLQGRAHAAYHEILDSLLAVGWELDPEDREARKVYAEHARERGDLTPLLFSLFGGKDIGPAIWKTLRPAGEKPYQRNLEEAA